MPRVSQGGSLTATTTTSLLLRRSHPFKPLHISKPIPLFLSIRRRFCNCHNRVDRPKTTSLTSNITEAPRPSFPPSRVSACLILVFSKSLWLLLITWMQLVSAIVNWHTNMCWRLILWTVNITTLPVRALSALRRVKMMERLLQEMQYELENLVWDNKKIQARLQIATKEHHFMKSMLSEIEEDHDKAIVRIELLEREVELLREENLQLREVRSKGHWDSKSETSTEKHEQISQISQKFTTKSPPRELTNPAFPVDPLTPLIYPNNLETLDEQRVVALSRSLFSAIFSLIVGTIIWKAEDPCFPLVMALFAVVFLSLRSVVQYFSTIRNRPASDAVALLCFNWFILGALACPTFPQVARLMSPVFGAFLRQT